MFDVLFKTSLLVVRYLVKFKPFIIECFLISLSVLSDLSLPKV